MGKGLGIAGLVLLIVSLFVPFFGNFITLLALVVVALGALFGERAYAIAVTVVAAVKQFFLSPSWMILLYGTTDEDAKAEFMALTIICLALPLVAIVMNGIGRQAVGKANESSDDDN